MAGIKDRGDDREADGTEGDSGASPWAMALFVVYLVFYGGFVFLNAFAPSFMEATPAGGINIAVLYGVGLIAAAFLLALLYTYLSRGRRS